MAVTLCLSPWPNQGTQAESLALEYIMRACRFGYGTDDEEAEARALGQMAAARVEREAPNAPQAVKNQAVVRYIGYMRQSDFGQVRQEKVGDREAQFVVNHQRAWINCGAKSILSPWKRLNAAPITHASEAG